MCPKRQANALAGLQQVVDAGLDWSYCRSGGKISR